MGLLNKCYFDSLCQKGCTNYSQKWSCPPYAPNFKKYSQGYTYLTAIVLKVSVNEFDYIKNSYLKIKAANSVLKSRMDKMLRFVKKKMRPIYRQEVVDYVNLVKENKINRVLIQKK